MTNRHIAAVTSQWNLQLDHTKRNRRRRRSRQLQNENADEIICRRAKNRESSRRRRQPGAGENRAAGLTVIMARAWADA